MVCPGFVCFAGSYLEQGIQLIYRQRPENMLCTILRWSVSDQLIILFIYCIQCIPHIQSVIIPVFQCNNCIDLSILHKQGAGFCRKSAICLYSCLVGTILQSVRSWRYHRHIQLNMNGISNIMSSCHCNCCSCDLHILVENCRNLKNRSCIFCT